MTLCIAAMCESNTPNPKIVAVSDQMISFGDVASDRIALKSTPIHRNWYVLYASNNVGHVPFLLESAMEVLKAIKEPSATDVANALDKSFGLRLGLEIESAVLRRHRYTQDEFKKEGRNNLGDVVFAEIVKRIGEISLQTQVIACGFDGVNEPHLIEADGEGQPLEYSPVGFCAIGSGNAPAVDSLLFYADRKLVNQNSALEEVLYVSCAAKFMAESVPSVGKKTTFVSIFEANKRIRYLRPLAWKKIKSTWEAVGMPAMPTEFLKEIPSMILTGEELMAEMQVMQSASQKSGRGQ